jgi:hypothetical protein
MPERRSRENGALLRSDHRNLCNRRTHPLLGPSAAGYEHDEGDGKDREAAVY